MAREEIAEGNHVKAAALDLRVNELAAGEIILRVQVTVGRSRRLPCGSNFRIGTVTSSFRRRNCRVNFAMRLRNSAHYQPSLLLSPEPGAAHPSRLKLQWPSSCCPAVSGG